MACCFKEALASAKEPSEGILASIISFVVLLFGATCVLGELQEAFERLWVHGSDTDPAKQNWWHTASLRLRGIGDALAFGFMLMVSLVISTLLYGLSGWAGVGFGFETLPRVINEMVALPHLRRLVRRADAHQLRAEAAVPPTSRWEARRVRCCSRLAGSCSAAYLATAAVVSAYGAAGSLAGPVDVDRSLVGRAAVRRGLCQGRGRGSGAAAMLPGNHLDVATACCTGWQGSGPVK